MPPSQASNLAYSAVAILASLLIMMQLPVRFQPTKSSNWLFIIWISMTMLNSSINAIVWNNNVVNWAPVWCDISSYVVVASNFGVQLSLLCIARRTYGLMSGKVIRPTADQERRGMLWDIFIGIGIPVLFLPLTYVVESNDFVLVEQVGCYPSILRTIPGIFLHAIWPVIFALVSAIYSALTMFYMLQRRRARREFQVEDVSDKVESYQWRLALLASAQIVLILPSAIYFLVSDATGPQDTYTWDYVHVSFSAVYTFSISQWTYDTMNFIAFEWIRWSYVIYAFLFTAFVGWTEAARSHYNRYYAPAFLAAARVFGYRAQNPQSARFDLERAQPARGPIFRTFQTSLGTSLGTSQFASSSQVTATYRTTNEEVVSIPQPRACIMSTSNDKDQTGTAKSLQLPNTTIPATQLGKTKTTHSMPASGAQSFP